MSRTIANLMVVIGANATALEKSLSKAEKNLNKFGRVATNAGAILTKAITLPILAIGGAALKTYADFEKAMTQSTAIMGNLSDEMRKDMEKAAREVAKTTRFSATQAAESYFYLASAGLDAAQSMAALPKVAAFAQAGNFDMALATDLLTDAQSALGLTIRDDVVKNMENMVRVSDVLVKANVLANATVQQFSESLTNKAGAALRLLNKDIEEGAAVLAVFADQGLKGAAAGESLSIVLRDLQRASILNRAQFEKFGVQVYDTTGKMNNIADIIWDIESALKGMSDEQVRTTLMMMGFQDRSVQNIMALLGTSDALRSYEKDLRSAGGVTEEVAEKQLNNLWDQLGLIKDRVLDAGLTLGEALGDTIQDTVLPATDDLIGRLEKAAEKFAKLTKEEQESIIKKWALIAVTPLVIFALGQLAFAIASIIGLFKILGGAKVIGLVIAGFKGIGVAILALATATGLPVASVILIILGLIAVGVALYKNWEKVKENSTTIWNYIADHIKIKINEMVGDINWLIDQLNRIKGVDIGKIGTLELSTEKAAREAREAAGAKSLLDLVLGKNRIPSPMPVDQTIGLTQWPVPPVNPTKDFWNGLKKSAPAFHHSDYFDKGGIVSGPRGAPRPILAHGGETVLPTHKSGFGTSQTIHHTFDPVIVRGETKEGVIATMKAVIDELPRIISDGDRRIPSRTRLVPIG